MIRLLENATIEDFDTIYGLMVRAFPPEELREASQARKLLHSPHYHLLKAVNSAQDINGFFAYWTFSDFHFLEHFAVDPSLRGQGIGTRMLQNLMLQHPGDWLLEAEAPMTSIAQRRIDFYRRNGFVVNAFGYHQPIMQETAEERLIPLQILTYDTPWSLARLQMAKELIMNRVYRSLENRQDA